MNIDCCVTATLLHLRNLGFDVDVVSDASWTTNYAEGTDPVLARDMAVANLKLKNIPAVLTKDVP